MTHLVCYFSGRWRQGIVRCVAVSAAGGATQQRCKGNQFVMLLIVDECVVCASGIVIM